MEIKRRYDTTVTPPQLVGYTVVHTGNAALQRFSHRFVQDGMAAGLVHIEGDRLTLVCEPMNLHYTVQRVPGYYCKSTGQRIPLSDMAMTEAMTRQVAILAPREARAWLLSYGLPATDYEAPKDFQCELDADQHQAMAAVLAPSGLRVAASSLNTQGA